MNYINHYINKIICGNALEVLKEIPDESVNCCICSPPYWNLRDYGVEGQLGLEKTFEEYITKLCNIFDEVKRVLRKDGTCWIVIGDTYGGSGNRSGHTLETSNLNRLTVGYGATGGNVKLTKGYEKCLLDIPYRFSIEMTNRGWVKRNTLIWWKLSCIPSSANDRFTVDFEYLFFFTKNNKTLFWTNEKTLECVDKKPLGTKGKEGVDWEWRLIGENYENYNTKISREDAEKYNSLKARKYRKKEIKKISLWTGHDYWFKQQFEELNYDSFRETKRGKNQPKAKIGDLMSASVNARKSLDGWKINPNGRNKRCVWVISTRAFPEAHFAVYPEGLIEIPIKAGCPEFVCKKCGKARVKIYKTIGKQITKNMKIAGCNKEGKYIGTEQKDYKSAFAQRPSETKKRILKSMSQVKESYYSDCGCNAGFEGGIILDPFMGAGTTALVALKQRKRFIGIEIKQEYIDMANRRITKVQQEIF
ncbi:site-specific DNA-methyltransferase [Candidatus Atribacteria bacterium 1244-E10-H5-B2]|nr:MAG: site-specific DNA-methyltransferase [Candidatus Atribacteria bacterium 1244-E10-H5-B2]